MPGWRHDVAGNRVTLAVVESNDQKRGDCPVCDEPWDLRRDPRDPEVWRFVPHTRTRVHPKTKSVQRGVPCSGAGCTYEEAFIERDKEAAR
jgi:hypothetical protein